MYLCICVYVYAWKLDILVAPFFIKNYSLRLFPIFISCVIKGTTASNVGLPSFFFPSSFSLRYSS